MAGIPLELPLLGVAVAFVAFVASNPIIRRLGPRNAWRLALLGWILGLLVVAVHDYLRLPIETAYVDAVWLGLAFALAAWAQVGTLRACANDRRLFLWTAAAIPLGGIVWWVSAGLLGHAVTLVLFALVTLVAWSLLRHVPDPVHPDDPTRRLVPYTDGSGRPPRSGWRKLVAAPAASIYLAVTWALFLPFAEERRGILQLPFALTERFAYHIPILTQDPLSIPRVLVTAPLVNHDVVQLVYVTLLVALFAFRFEAREGTRRFLLVFVGFGSAAAILAGALLHVLYPEVSTHPVLEQAWERSWSGGSAASFAVMGAFAGRARAPWPLLGLFVFWEINVGWWFLRSYTPAFHLAALAMGFAWARWGPPPRGPKEGPAG